MPIQWTHIAPVVWSPDIRIELQEVDCGVLTPGPETGELLEVGLGAINGELCDNTLHFILVNEGTNDHYDHSNGVSTGAKLGNQGMGLGELPSWAMNPSASPPSVLYRSNGSVIMTSRNIANHPHIEEVETLGLELDLPSRSRVSFSVATTAQPPQPSHIRSSTPAHDPRAGPTSTHSSRDHIPDSSRNPPERTGTESDYHPRSRKRRREWRERGKRGRDRRISVSSWWSW